MKKIFAILFAIVVGFGIVFRFIFLCISFEYDELFTAVTADPSVPLSYIWNHYLMVDVHPPLYNVILWVYEHFVPYGPEWILRFPSLLFGLITLWEGWFLFPRYLGRMARWLFIVLLSCNFYLILYSQCARAYALMVCVALPLTFLYLNLSRRVLKNRPIATKQWVLFGVLSLILCWCHYFGALLFGLFSTILFVLAWKRKRKLTPFILTPLLVVIGFSPWLLPNLMQNLAQDRFSGNWWANTSFTWRLVVWWVEFFFSAKKAFAVLCVMAALRVAEVWIFPHKHGKWPYIREQILVFSPLFFAGIFVVLMSIKIYWLVWRYFMPFIPCLYLLVCLFLAPLCRKHQAVLWLFLLFVILSFRTPLQVKKLLYNGVTFPARGSMEIIKEAFADKELFVVAAESFPKESMDSMYGYYLHKQFGTQIPVTEVFQMDKDEFDKVIIRQKDGVFWMPNCEGKKMDQVVEKWNRNVAIFARYETTCFLIFAEDNGKIDEDLLADYQLRFSNYAVQVLEKMATH